MTETQPAGILFQEHEDAEAIRDRIYDESCDGITARDILDNLQADHEDYSLDTRTLTIEDVHGVRDYWKKEIKEERAGRKQKAEEEQRKKEREARFQALKAEGKPFEQIARETGEPLETVIAWGKEHAGTLQTMDAIRLESLKEKFPVFKAQRLAVLGEQINRIRDELSKRDLADVPTGDLFRAFGQLVKLTKDEDPQEPTIQLKMSARTPFFK